ncbi:hypothetical protein FA15DRAFT_633554 [Coprinopsis marcescibilis]|uniref:Uncharacterized protein n=1 Tax=Coprinopsis marcescibilis TaxID=230819 RepID=A0A5C3L6H1_COPMA|nr:hypothetical protein FA15DRAFT_633554 [Coprinopsis marcescibilis]
MPSQSRSNASRPAPRVHRLPRHRQLDYILVPAPLDLSLPDATEKSPLPAIIVTPSSPSSIKDFSIAFLAPPKKQGWRERAMEYCFQGPQAHPASPPITTATSTECSWKGSWSGWLRSPVTPAIALPIVSPTSGDAPSSWHADPPSKKRRRPAALLLIIATSVFFLVLCQVFSQYTASHWRGPREFRDAVFGDEVAVVNDAQLWQPGGWFGAKERMLHGDHGGAHQGQGFGREGADLRLPVGRFDHNRQRMGSPTDIPPALRSAIARNEV